MKKLPPKKFFKNIFVIEVLSENEPIKEGTPLGWVEESMRFGECSGTINLVSVKLTGKEAAEFLLEQGKDPRFYEIDEDGNRLDQWQ